MDSLDGEQECRDIFGMVDGWDKFSLDSLVRIMKRSAILLQTTDERYDERQVFSYLMTRYVYDGLQFLQRMKNERQN